MKTIVRSDPSHQILFHCYQKVHYFQQNYCDLKTYPDGGSKYPGIGKSWSLKFG